MEIPKLRFIAAVAVVHLIGSVAIFAMDCKIRHETADFQCSFRTDKGHCMVGIQVSGGRADVQTADDTVFMAEYRE